MICRRAMLQATDILPSHWQVPDTTQLLIGGLISCGFILCCMQIYTIFIWPFYVSPLRHLPGPKDNAFFLGQASKFTTASWLPNVFGQWSRQWPEAPFVRYLNFANSETLIVNSMASYKEILQTKASSFVKPSFARKFAHETIGDGLQFAEAPVHKPRRATLLKPFKPQQLRALFPVVQGKAKQMADVLFERQDEFGNVEVETTLWKTTLDIIGIATLGIDLDHLRVNTSLLYEAFTTVMQPTFFGHAVNYFNSIVPIRRYLPFKECREHTRLTDALRTYIRNQIRNRHSAMILPEKSDNPDALQYMMEHSDPSWDEKEIIENTLSFLVLGHETTACAIIWAFHELSRRPDLQQRLRAEVTQMLETTPEPSYSDIDKLPFLNNFVYETLRLYCPVALAPRQATEDVIVAGTMIPKGTVLQLSPAVMNLHPLIWGSTAAQFDPDRWASRTGDAASVFAFESFHHGTRMCVGRMLTLMEMKTFLAEMVTRFHVGSLVGGKDLEVAGPTFTLRPKDKLCVSLTAL